MKGHLDVRRKTRLQPPDPHTSRLFVIQKQVRRIILFVFLFQFQSQASDILSQLNQSKCRPARTALFLSLSFPIPLHFVLNHNSFYNSLPLSPLSFCPCTPSSFPSCRYNFMWASAYACPLCTYADYEAVYGKCAFDTPYTAYQRVTYVPKYNPNRCVGKVHILDF